MCARAAAAAHALPTAPGARVGRCTVAHRTQHRGPQNTAPCLWQSTTAARARLLIEATLAAHGTGHACMHAPGSWWGGRMRECLHTCPPARGAAASTACRSCAHVAFATSQQTVRARRCHGHGSASSLALCSACGVFACCARDGNGQEQAMWKRRRQQRRGVLPVRPDYLHCHQHDHDHDHRDVNDHHDHGHDHNDDHLHHHWH